MPLSTNPAVLRLITLLALTSTVRGIRFNISTPMQCEPLEVTWEEKQGDGDMRLLIMPAAEFSPQSIILNITIPSSASSPYTIPTFSEPQGLEFVASLIDSSGYSNTGVTEILTVGSPSSSGSASCLSTAPDPDFFFYTDPQAPTTVPQCGNVQVTWQNSYTLPASIVGLIPGGEIWTIHEITGPDQGGGQGAAGSGYGWQVNVREGTRFLMYMPNNGPVGSGGSTPLFTVGAGGSGCISDSSPSSIAPSAPASTISGVGGGGGRPGGGSGSDSAGDNSSGSGSGSNTGAIVGGAVGGVAFVVLALIVLFVFLRRRARQVKDPQHPRTKLMGSYGTSHGSSGGGTGSGAVVGGAALMEDRRRSSVVDLLAGEKPRNGSHSAANGMATAGAIERQDSDETTYEPSPYFSSGANTASPGAVRSSFPRTSDEITSANTNGQNRYSRESGMLAPIDFGTGAGLGMAGMTAGSDRQRRASETTYQPGSEADATLSHSGATVSPRGNPDMTHAGGELGVGGSPNLGSTGRSNSTRKRRPLTAQNGDEAPVPPPTRFVLHQDAGVVDSAEATRPDDQGLVEMPPRYDQLRSGPPQ